MKNKDKKPKLVVILGPTASGKTDLSLKLAKKFSGYIISADSRQIYKELDIGTNKPLGKWKKIKNKKIFLVENIPHYLTDIIKPNQNFTVAQFKNEAYKIIKENNNKLGFVVGGTPLYIYTLIENFEIPQVPPNFILRKKLEKEIKEKGLAFLYEKLLKLDPEANLIVDPFNPRRVIRALEVILTLKKPFSQLRKKSIPPFDFLLLGILISKKELRKKINKRVDKMFKEGLVEEVKNLLKKYSPDLPSLSGIGYREIILYLKGEMTLNQAKEKIKINTWRFAKKQLSWFKKDYRIHWIKNLKEAEKLIISFLKT